jgi:NAD(P)-dependent dehydrogenase (short-subunit alcohol dehydrogenase family)
VALGTAVVVGVGPGLGGALARAFADDDQDWASGTAIRVLGARVAANAVLPELRKGRGSLLFSGGGFALHPSKEYASLSVGKAALRAYVQVLHDQLTGTGVHVTSVMITKGIDSEARFDSAALAQAYVGLHSQPETDWQPELVSSPFCLGHVTDAAVQSGPTRPLPVPRASTSARHGTPIWGLRPDECGVDAGARDGEVAWPTRPRPPVIPPLCWARAILTLALSGGRTSR